MKPKNILIDYIKNLLKITNLVLLGIVGFIGSFLVDTLFPSANPWIYYAILIIVSILVAGYYAYKDLRLEKQDEVTSIKKENISLKQQIRLLTERQPKININFSDKVNSPSKEITLRLQTRKQHDIDIQDFIKNKRQELLDKIALEEKKLVMGSGMFINITMTPRQRIEEYLDSLRKYYQDFEEWEFINQKGFLIYPNIKNIGHASATNITIELATTQKDIILTGEKYLDVKLALQGNRYKPSPPKEPILGLFSLDPSYSIFDLPPVNAYNSDLYQSDVSLPEYSFTSQEAVVVYKISKLVHGLSENDVEPFLIWLGGISENTSLQIEARIYAEEIFPSPQLDKLYIHVILEN